MPMIFVVTVIRWFACTRSKVQDNFSLARLIVWYFIIFFFIGELQGGELPYWRLDAKRPYLLPSSKPCGVWTPKLKDQLSFSQVVLGLSTGLHQYFIMPFVDWSWNYHAEYRHARELSDITCSGCNLDHATRGHQKCSSIIDQNLSSAYSWSSARPIKFVRRPRDSTGASKYDFD